MMKEYLTYILSSRLDNLEEYFYHYNDNNKDLLNIIKIVKPFKKDLEMFKNKLNKRDIKELENRLNDLRDLIIRFYHINREFRIYGVQYD